jgi:hypothetical protein
MEVKKVNEKENDGVKGILKKKNDKKKYCLLSIN